MKCYINTVTYSQYNPVLGVSIERTAQIRSHRPLTCIGAERKLNAARPKGQRPCLVSRVESIRDER